MIRHQSFLLLLAATSVLTLLAVAAGQNPTCLDTYRTCAEISFPSSHPCSFLKGFHTCSAGAEGDTSFFETIDFFVSGAADKENTFANLVSTGQLPVPNTPSCALAFAMQQCLSFFTPCDASTGITKAVCYNNCTSNLESMCELTAEGSTQLCDVGVLINIFSPPDKTDTCFDLVNNVGEEDQGNSSSTSPNHHQEEEEEEEDHSPSVATKKKPPIMITSTSGAVSVVVVAASAMLLLLC